MKLTKKKEDGPIEIDLTPMIDVTFQLIIFFMLLTDMTTADLEVLSLPKAESAIPDKPNPKDKRPVLNVVSDGRIFIKRELMYDPNKDDGYQKLQKFLAQAARAMPKEHVTKDDPSSPMAPDRPVLVRVDRAAPFKHVQKIMEICGKEDIKIWKIEFAAAESKPDENAPGGQGGR